MPGEVPIGVDGKPWTHTLEGPDPLLQVLQAVAADTAPIADATAIVVDAVVGDSAGEVGTGLLLSAVPPLKFAKLLKKPARSLISGSLKRSKSYRAGLADQTYEEIIRLSKGDGKLAQATRQMKKLIEASSRLRAKGKGKPK